MREISIVGVLFTLACALYSTGFGGLLLWNAQSGGANADQVGTLGVWALVVAAALYVIAGVSSAVVLRRPHRRAQMTRDRSHTA